MASRAGALVVAPPGVLLRREDGAVALSQDGWREARWAPNADNCVLIDQARPIAHIEVPLAQVVEDIAEWCPHQLSWIAAHIDRRIRLTIGRMQARDHNGYPVPDEDAAAFRELVHIVGAADRAFGAISHGLGPAWYLKEDAFSRQKCEYLRTIEAAREDSRVARPAGAPRPQSSLRRNRRRGDEGTHLRVVR
jgi:hypothetical protein